MDEKQINSDLLTADSQRLPAVLAAYVPRSDEEAADLARMRALAAAPNGDPWTRASPLHMTASAVVVHPPSRRVLLRWHDRMGSWLQVGGHGDPGEDVPYAIALREAAEETGLPDLAAWPDPTQPLLLQIAVVPVPAGKGEPAHEHADLRYVLSTARPDEIRPESPGALLRWLDLAEATSAVAEDNLRVCLLRLGELLSRP
jgi:8-oxo-dGTP pyrophosphatase MutT (NUDIX family)